MQIALAKSRSVRGASRHPAFMDNCPTISHVLIRIYLVRELLSVRLSWSVGPDVLWP